MTHEKSQKHYITLRWYKEPVSKGCAMSDSTNMTFSERQNASDREQVRGLGREGLTTKGWWVEYFFGGDGNVLS
jgi:hypothetical protein